MFDTFDTQLSNGNLFLFYFIFKYHFQKVFTLNLFYILRINKTCSSGWSYSLSFTQELPKSWPGAIFETFSTAFGKEIHRDPVMALFGVVHGQLALALAFLSIRLMLIHQKSKKKKPQHLTVGECI